MKDLGKIYKGLIKIFLLVFVLSCFVNSNEVLAAADKTKPSISAKPYSIEPTTGTNKIKLYVKDTSGLASVKWASGNRTTSYFAKSGYKVTLDSNGKTNLTVKKNGIYTIYAKDKAGNERVKTVTISNIDKASPTVSIKKSTTAPTNSNVYITLTIKDEGLGVKSVKYIGGKKSEKDFETRGKDLAFTKKSETNNAYDNSYEYTANFRYKINYATTFLIEDYAGNKTIQRAYVTNIDKTAPTLTYKYSTTKPTNGSVKVTFTVADEDSGIDTVRLASGSLTASDFTNNTGKVVALNASNQGSFTVTKNSYNTLAITDKAGNITTKVIKVSVIDKTAPTAELTYTVMNQRATVNVDAYDSKGIGSIFYLKGYVTNTADERWTTKAKVVNDNKFYANSSGNYSVLVKDVAGNMIIKNIKIDLEFRAVWISYLEFANYGRNGFTEASFKSTIDTMFDNVAAMNMNAVVVQVRPFGDAMYDSKYFPWSRYISGTQGVDPGFDPLQYMVEAAHARDLSIHAWLNPYRVTSGSTDYTKLAKDNPARVWYEDKDKSNDRNVLAFDGSLYYNPAVKEVQNLIIKGIKEIVMNYDVDGIHFDDYFYPVLGSKYKTNFDAPEYEEYVALREEQGKSVYSIGDWRRYNVNTLIKNVYSSIKNIDSTVEFGISPGGFIDYLSSDQGYYVDYKTWLSSDNYIDYLAPQIYWSFSNSTFPYAKTLDRWLSFRKSDTVKMYVGIATYKAGSSLETEWKNDPDVLKKQVEYGRDTGLVDGYIFFRYDFFYDKVTKKAVDALLPTLKNTY